MYGLRTHDDYIPNSLQAKYIFLYFAYTSNDTIYLIANILFLMSHDHDSKLLFMIFNSRDSKDHIPTAQGNINAFWLIYIIGFAIFKLGIFIVL